MMPIASWALAKRLRKAEFNQTKQNTVYSRVRVRELFGLRVISERP